MDSRQTFVFCRPWNWRYLLRPHHFCRIFVNGVLVSDIKNGETLSFTLPVLPLYLIGIAESREEDFPCTHVCIRPASDDSPIHISIRPDSEIPWHTLWKAVPDDKKYTLPSPMLERINRLYILPETDDASVSDTERTVLLCNEFLIDTVDGLLEVLRNARFYEILNALDAVGDTVWSARLRASLKACPHTAIPMTDEEYSKPLESEALGKTEEEWRVLLSSDLRTLYRQIIEYLLARLQ